MALTGDPRLPTTTYDLLDRVTRVAVSVISFHEIGQKVRLGKWPDMAPHVAELETGARTAVERPLLHMHRPKVTARGARRAPAAYRGRSPASREDGSEPPERRITLALSGPSRPRTACVPPGHRP